MDKKLTDDELQVFIHLMAQGKLDSYISEAMDSHTDLDNHSINEIPVKINRSSSWKWWSIAATIIIVLGFGLYLTNLNKKSVINPAKDVNVIRIVNSSALISKQTLPDGSTIWIQPGTTISYPANFTQKSLREVNMSGEAFFEVTKDAAHPFVITTGKVLTKVWGTSFKISSIPGRLTRVSVLTGKVSVSINDNNTSVAEKNNTSKLNVMLKPDEEAIYAENNKDLKKTNVSPQTGLLIWHKLNLTFENASLGTVIKALQNNYQVNIKTSSPDLNDRHITADLNGNNLPDILMMISKSLHVTYSMQGNDIVISK
ncbi:FecR family protein [Mucilaginibacter sp.]|uniref:FecR family protein n=1 Tax=Mucilaginibacter sp. TaxID=1882438 RepID=UPI0031B56EEF